MLAQDQFGYIFLLKLNFTGIARNTENLGTFTHKYYDMQITLGLKEYKI